MISPSMILLVFAFVLFTVEAVRTKSLIAVGLACWSLSILVAGHIIGR